MKRIIACLSLYLLLSGGVSAEEATFKNGSPIDNLPSYVTQLTHFGQRADWSHDGKRILFLERTYGDVYEIELATKVIRPMTHHYYHEGYTRALYLANGDMLLSGSRSFDAEDPGPSRWATAELWVLDKSLKKAPVALGAFCSEGPAVSRKNMSIAWTVHGRQYPDLMPEEAHQFWMAEIRYEDGKPELANKKTILDSRKLSFKSGLETQNFRPPHEKELIFSAYGYQGTEVMGLEVATGKVVNYSQGVNSYEEPEGIFPSGEFTCVERAPDAPDAFETKPKLDIWKLKLDGSAQWERLTFFSGHLETEAGRLGAVGTAYFFQRIPALARNEPGHFR
jgi:hypothetical protein